MIGLGIKSYTATSLGRKMYGSSAAQGKKMYGNSPIVNKPTIKSHPETLYKNSHNANIQYVPFGTKQIHLHEDKLKLHVDTVKKHDGNLIRMKYDDDKPGPAITKQKLFK